MRVVILNSSCAQILADKLNELLKWHEGEEIEIQYQLSAYQLGSVYYSAMVIFK